MNRVRLEFVALVALGTFTLSVAVSAHHGTAVSYDQTRTVTLEGVVTEFAWRNPHAQIYFDVEEEDGTIVHWAAENSSPRALEGRGWTRDSLKPGDRVTITVFPSKAGTPVGVLSHLELEDGTELFRRNPND